MDNQRQADDLTKARLAGFFAGEGCICCEYSSKHAKTPRIRVYIGNTERCWPEEYQALYGGSIYTQIVKTKNYPYYKYSASDYQAERLLRDLLPFIKGEKLKQIEIALQVIDIKKHKISGVLTQSQRLEIERLFFKFREYRRAVAETKRANLSPTGNDSPILEVIREGH